jgi:hypothetical protein
MGDLQQERRRYSRRFIRLLVDFVAVRGADDRAKFEKNHPRVEGMENWEHAMHWRLVDPLEIHKLVRTYVDEWINTGLLSDGSEAPEIRAFRPVYFSKGGAAKAPSACVALADMAERIRPQMSFGMRGGITHHPRGLSSPTPEILAGEIFLEFYCSEWLYRIMRCNHCKAIVVFDREPRARYVRGWHCPKCSKKVTARVSTTESRDRQREAWLAPVTGAFLQYESKRPKGDRVDWIRDEINKKLPLVHRIKRHRVTILSKLFDGARAAGMSAQEAIIDAVTKYKQPKGGK